MRKTFYISRDLLVNTFGVKEVIFDASGPVALNRDTCRGPKTVYCHPIVTKHKYGKDLTYLYFSLSHQNKIRHIPVADVAYLLYHPECDSIPEGYEVDHIDDNPLNNNPENLQLLTHLENIRKRPIACNQWRYIKG